MKKTSNSLGGTTVQSCASACVPSLTTTCCQTDNCNIDAANPLTVASCWVKLYLLSLKSLVSNFLKRNFIYKRWVQTVALSPELVVCQPKIHIAW